MAQTHFSKLDEESKALHDSWDHIFRIILLVTLLTFMVWACTSLLRYSVHAALELLFHPFEEEHPENLSMGITLIVVMVLGGWIRGLLTVKPQWAASMGDGMNDALSNYHITKNRDTDGPSLRYQRPSFSAALRKCMTTLITLGTGNSGGLEAPMVAISEGLSSGFARIMQVRNGFELRTYQLAGISAAVSTLLGAPFTAALFATEILYGDRIIYRNLAYSMWAGVIAYILNNRFHGFKPLFVTAAHTPEYTIYEYGGSVLVALTVAVPVTIGFAYLVSSADRLIGHVESQWQAVWTSFLSAVVALLWFWGFGISPSIILGMGEGFLEDILTGEDHSLSIKILSLALIGKMIATGLTMRGGGSAGLLIPSMFFGGVAGALTALVFSNMTGISLDPSLFAVVGISTSLVAVIGVPLASIALVLEVFGPTFGPPTILASGATYLITLHIKIYKFQESSPSPENDEIGTINNMETNGHETESIDSKEHRLQQDAKEQTQKN